MVRERLASKPASRRQALRRFRARGAWLDATLLPRAGRVLPDELRAENAECNVLMLDDATGRTMAQAFEENLGQSLEIGLETWNQRPLAHRCGDALARCLSPLL